MMAYVKLPRYFRRKGVLVYLILFIFRLWLALDKTDSSKAHVHRLEDFTLSFNNQDLKDFEPNPQLLFYNKKHSRCYDCTLKEPSFTVANTHRCSGESVDILFLINSAPKNLQKRRSIRITWANEVIMKSLNVQYVFILGVTKKIDLVKTESAMFCDIVVGDFNDTYRNLGVKTIHGLKWAVDFCQAKKIIKTDDDLIYDIYNLPKLINRIDSHKSLHGNCLASGVPHRNPRSKWYASFRLYKDEFYGPFCLGALFILDIMTAELLIQSSKEIPYFHIEDVYISYLCASRFGITTKHINGFSLPDTELDLGNKMTGVSSTLLSKPVLFYKYWVLSQKSCMV